jgi:hypothetical protein
MVFLAAMLGAAPAPAVTSTVLERRMEITRPERRSPSRSYPPAFHATIKFRRDDGRTATWKGRLDTSFPEEALRLYDHFQPGARVEIPITEEYSERPAPSPELVRYGIGGLLALLVLFFGLPVLHLLGIRMWITSPVRLFAIFGLGALGAAAYLGQRMYVSLTTWPAVEALREKSDPVALLEARGSEITLPEEARAYIASRATDVLNYDYQGKKHSYVMHNMTSIYKAGPPCQTGETCRVLVDPKDPAELSLPQPVTAETFTAPLALGGFGVVFLLAGLLIRR